MTVASEVARMGENRENAYEILVGKQKVKIPFQIPIRRWKNNY
jgi:hypothetical protein